MPIIAWATLIALSFIFIFIGLALVVFLTFFASDGANPGGGVAVFLVAAVVIAALLPDYRALPVYSASVVAVALLMGFAAVVIRILLSNVDNKDAIKAFRPLVLFTIISGFSIAIFNLARIIAA